MEKTTQRRLLLSFALLLVTLIVVVIKNRDFWFGNDEASVEEPAAAPVKKSVTPAPATSNPAPAVSSSVPAAAAVKKSDKSEKTDQVAANKPATEPAVAQAAVMPGTRVELPPMEVEVVAGDSHRRVRPGSNSVLVQMPPKSKARSADASAFKWSPATNAAEKTRIAANELESIPRPVELSYPSLDKQMKVQGSVLLQALVAADGGIRDLHVLSGNPILTSAAMEAARQWRFRPYLQNGQPVETQAKIMVNFTIKIL